MAHSFMTYEQQLTKLSSEKDLTIIDTDYAKKILERTSYFSLIGGYKSLFKNPSTGKYKYNVTFEELVAFYYFDEELRTLFLKYILHVERHIKSMFSYYFCEKYGENHQEYLTPSNYGLNHKNSRDINRLTDSLKKVISLPSHYSYINHHLNTYHNVPLWVTMNALTFGQVSKMYQYATSDIRSKISKNYSNLSEKQLHQMITILAKCRNVCAHGERLFSFSTTDTIPDMPLHTKMSIPKKKGQYALGKHDLFSIVIALRYLLDVEEFKRFKTQLVHLISKVLKSCPHLSEEELLAYMGFPETWKSISRYKI